MNANAGVTAGAAAQAAEARKHAANNQKCSDLGWSCIPPYGKEVHTSSNKSKATFYLYSRLNLALARGQSTMETILCPIVSLRKGFSISTMYYCNCIILYNYYYIAANVPSIPQCTNTGEMHRHSVSSIEGK